MYRFKAVEEEDDVLDEAQFKKPKKLQDVSLEVAPQETITTSVKRERGLEGTDVPAEEAKGLLTNKMNRTALLQMKKDNMAGGTSRVDKMKLFLAVTLR